MYFLDLDNFKPLNDQHGHATGDLLLIEAARRLKHCIREVDTAARFGGDEFVVVVDSFSDDMEASKAQALIVGRKLSFSLSLPYLLHVNQGGSNETTVVHHCTASIGVALFGASGDSPFDALKRADSAMYAAKMGGRNQLRFVTSSDEIEQSPSPSHAQT